MTEKDIPAASRDLPAITASSTSQEESQPATSSAPESKPAVRSALEVRYEQHLEALRNAKNIFPKPIMNQGEVQIFYGAERALRRHRLRKKGWTIHAQPSLAEILEICCADCEYYLDEVLISRCEACYRAFLAINGKRPDIVICNSLGKPVLIIEHQGCDHIDRSTPRHENESRLRNKVKELAYAKSGVRYIPTSAGTTRKQASEKIYQELAAILNTAAPSS